MTPVFYLVQSLKRKIVSLCRNTHDVGVVGAVDYELDCGLSLGDPGRTDLERGLWRRMRVRVGEHESEIG